MEMGIGNGEWGMGELDAMFGTPRTQEYFHVLSVFEDTED